MDNVDVNKAIPIPCTRKTFYKMWLSFLAPVHHFTPQVIGVAAELLRHREILSKKILDEVMLTNYLQRQEVRDQIMKDCDITLPTFRVTINKLKKGGFFKDGKINPRLIPNLGDLKEFNFMLMFMIEDEE